MYKWALLGLLCVCPCFGTFTLVQAKVNLSCSTSGSCAVTVTSTGGGHVVVVGIADNANQTITSITCAPTACTGGNAYTLCGAPCQKGATASGWVDMAYTLNSAASDTTITINHTAGSNNSIGMVWEYSSTGTPAFDASGSAAPTCTTSCAGTALTIGGSNDVISTAASCGGTCSAITTYSADPATPWPGGDGMAHLLNTVSGTAPTWTQSSDTNFASAAIAIKDASGGAPTRPPVVY